MSYLRVGWGEYLIVRIRETGGKILLGGIIPQELNRTSDISKEKEKDNRKTLQNWQAPEFQLE